MTMIRFSLTAFLALLPGGSVVRAAELRTLKGDVYVGEVVSLTDKQVVFAPAKGDKVTLPVAQVLQLDYSASAGKLPEGSFIDVELTDGSVIHCTAFGIKGKEAELTPAVTGQLIKLPLKVVVNVLYEAADEKSRKEWTARVAKKRRRDQVARRSTPGGPLVTLDGTFAEAADAAGTSIDFTRASNGETRPVPLDRLVGLIFTREPDPALPSVMCKVTDAGRNVLQASAVTTSATGVTVSTPSGAVLEYKPPQLARLDYSGGKLVWLSDMTPLSVDFKGVDKGRTGMVFADVNISNEPIRLNGVTYARGLSVLAPAELEYDLKGDFREFRAIAGLDDGVGGEGSVTLRIEGDGKELQTYTFDRKADRKRVADVRINIKDVQKLRLSVQPGDVIGIFGKHIDLADVKVSK